jgi:hypothetical protein
MRILSLHTRKLTFFLDKTDIGDYIEAEFVRSIGVKVLTVPTESQFPHPEINVCCVELLLLFSANDSPPENVEFRFVGPLNVAIMTGRRPGELLRMRPELLRGPHGQWWILGINGEIGSMTSAGLRRAIQ